MAGLDEIRQWVLRLGPEAEVVEPEELRESIKESLKRTPATYEGRPQPIQEEGEIQESRQDYAQQL